MGQPTILALGATRRTPRAQVLELLGAGSSGVGGSNARLNRPRYLLFFTELTANGTALRAALGASAGGPFTILSAVGGWGALRCVSSPTAYLSPRGGTIHVLYETTSTPCDLACLKARPAVTILRCKLPTATTLECSTNKTITTMSRRHGTALSMSLGELRALLSLGQLSRTSAIAGVATTAAAAAAMTVTATATAAPPSMAPMAAPTTAVDSVG